MRAAVLQSIGDTKLDLRDDVTTVGPDPDEVRVRIRATSMCHSDLSVMRGALPCRAPAVLGHEGAGEVVAVGRNVTAVRPGDRVVINGTPACGSCRQCLRAQPFLCITHVAEGFTKPRFRIGGRPAFGMGGTGSWAEETVLRSQAVVRIDDDVPFDCAALLGCGVPTGIGAVVNAAKVRPGSTVALIGAGGVGLSVIQGARLAGAATILAIDPLATKHPIAKRFGATHTATPATATGAKNTLTGGQGFDYVFEAVGRSATIRTAWQLARRGGEVVVVGAGAVDDTVEFSAFELLFDGKTLRGSLYGDTDMRSDVRTLVDLWRAGRLDLAGLISRRIRFDDLNDAVDALTAGDVIRQVVLFD